MNVKGPFTATVEIAGPFKVEARPYNIKATKADEKTK